MSTQKDIIHYSLFTYIAQRADYLARVNELPEPSVRRCLSELVAEGRAKRVKRDWFGAPGYLATRQKARRAT